MKDWVGVVYRAPRMVADAVITVALSDGEKTSEVESHVLVAPKVVVEFDRGKGPFPTNQDESYWLLTQKDVTMDINSTFKLKVCLAVLGDVQPEDIENAVVCEDAGLFKWEVNGSSVLVKGVERDLDYPQGQQDKVGYVTSLILDSDNREGQSVITYTVPDQVLTCNLTVENFAVTHPIDRVIIREIAPDNYDGTYTEGQELDERTFVIGDLSDASVEVLVYPESSYEFYEIEVVSSDPSVIEVYPKEEGVGYNRKFIAKKPGQAVITASALDKSKTMIANVVDKVLNLSLIGAPEYLLKGDVVDIQANVKMSSGTKNWIPQCEFTVSDPAVASVAPVAGKPDVVRLTALAQGKITLYVTCDGVTAAPVTIEVMDSADTTITTGDTRDVTLTFDGELVGLYITSVDSDDDYDLFIVEDLARDNIYGDYNYDNIDLTFKGAEISGAKLAFKVTADPDDEGYAYINGTVTLPIGTVITFSNLHAELELE